MVLIYVGIGGALGSITRYSIGKFISRRAGKAFPLATFLINITGAFLLGIVSSINIKNGLYLFAADGFLGAYTTYSTFMYEGFNLFNEKKGLNALVYILGSIFIGIIGFIIGTKVI